MLQAWLKSLMRLTNLLKDPHCVTHCGSAASGCTEKSQHELLFNCPSIHNDTSSWQSRGSSQKGHATFGGQSCWPREISPQLRMPCKLFRKSVATLSQPGVPSRESTARRSQPAQAAFAASAASSAASKESHAQRNRYVAVF